MSGGPKLPFVHLAVHLGGADLPTRRSVLAELIDHVAVFGARDPERFEIHWR